jgi:adenylate cyclase
VTPFASGAEPGRVALAGSMTDAVISALGRTRWLEVVEGDRSTILLRARYALLGRIERYGSHIQVIVRLAEVGSGRHLWGTTFDGSHSESPELWRQAIEGIAATVPVRLQAAEVARIDRKPPRERTVHDLVMQALSYSYKLTAEANSRALENVEKALSFDPVHPLAAALASWGHAQRAIYNFGGVMHAEREEVQRLASVALALGDQDPQALAILGTSLTMSGDLDTAEVLINRCLAIDPCCAMAWQRRGWIATYRGIGTALADFRRCVSLGGAHDLNRHNILFGVSSAHLLAGRYDRAADWAVRGIQQQPSATWAYRIAAPAQAFCGRKGDALKSTAMLLRHYPGMTVSAVVASLPNQPDFLARLAEGLEAAGLPL